MQDLRLSRTVLPEAAAQPAFVQVKEIAGPVDVVRAEGAIVYASSGRTLGRAANRQTDVA